MLFFTLADSRGSARFMIGCILLWSAQFAPFFGEESWSHIVVIRTWFTMTLVFGEMLKMSWESFDGVWIIRNWFVVITG